MNYPDLTQRPPRSARFIALMDQFMPKWQSHNQAFTRPAVHLQGLQNRNALSVLKCVAYSNSFARQLPGTPEE